MEPKQHNIPGLFEGTASYYSRYRFGYHAEVFDFLVDRFDLDRSTYVLDLGCGTGQIAIPLAQRGVAVRAVDPDIDMLVEGLRAENKSDSIRTAWQTGDDKSLEQLALPNLTLCAMGASFHWMDRDALMEKLDTLIKPLGAVVVLDGGRGTWSGGTRDWGDVTAEVIREFLGSERRAGGGTYSHPKDRHEVVLARSPFPNVERRVFTTNKTLKIDDIIGLQLSTSYASPAQLRENIERFRSVLRERLLECSPDGFFQGELSHQMLIATRH
jgi:SAM-dependent methyltransferase